MTYYSNLEEISQSLRERNSDERLKNEIERFYILEIGKEIPKDLKNKSCILARHIPVARKETLYAKAISQHLGINLSIPSYLADRYVNCSAEKRGFLNIDFEGESEKLELVDKYSRNEYDRKKASLNDIKIIGFQSLYEFHKDLSSKIIDFDTFDISKSFNKKKAPEYYTAYLSLFGGLNCLLEDYHGGESGEVLKKFTENVFEPAFHRMEKELGFKPLIYKLPWKNDFTQYIRTSERANELINEYKKELKN